MQFKYPDVLKTTTLRILLISLATGFLALGQASFVYGQSSKKLKTIIVDPGHGGTANGTVGEYEGSLRSKEKDIVLGISLKLVDILKKQMPDVNVIPTRTNDTTMSVKEKAKFANDHNGDLFVCIHADAVPLKTGSRILGYKDKVVYHTKYVGTGKNKKKVVTKQVKKVPIKEYYKIPTTRKGTSTLVLVARQTAEKVKAMENSEADFITDTEDSSYQVNYSSPEWKASALLYSQKYFRRSYLLANLVQEEIAQTGRPNLGVWQREEGLWVLHATQMPAILIETGFVQNYDDERYLNSESGQKEIAEAIAKAIIKYRDQINGPTRPAATTAGN
ncbi:MAG TPA: N-acetylmuramoyl-L-alanine amidase [Ginsengibacter sp.]|nr:N-acetylmuramoyl-L-alanine amidase [Ginsengibacter sp.]